MNKLPSRRPRARFALRSTVAWPVAAALPMICMTALAGGVPTGATVTGGKVIVTTPKAGSVLVDQSSQRGVIRWSDFSVAQGNQVTFAQPGTGSSTLNIVSGPNASLIAGTLRSTGSIFLVNPSGVTITANGLVDTGAGFIASTLGISEADYMNGTLRFNGAGGAVVNQGRITAGNGGIVALLGSTVRNDGVINAPLGKVGLGSGQSATLDLGGDGFLQVLLPANATTADGRALVDNSGVIQADGGTVALKAATVRDAVRNAVNMPGEIRARSISGHDGAIVLDGGDGGSVAVAGSLDASAGMGAVDGGRIDVSGATIALQGATVTATGVDQGGLVRIGGAFQGGKTQDAASTRTELYIGRFGATPALANAERTDIDAATSINVSASGAASVGGTAIVWSNGATTMLGRLDASGVKSGGAVEISSATQIQQIALPAIKVGAGGTLLLDPANIQITDGAATGTTGDQPYASNPGGTTQLSTSDILGQLNAGANVSLQASNDITWNTFYAGVQPTGGLVNGGNLALSAGRSITLNGVFNSYGGTWTMTANDTAAHGVVSAERQAGLATIDLGGAHFINNNGHLDLSVLDGLGNAERDADGIRLGVYSGDSITAYVSPTATGPGRTRIVLAGDDQAAGSIILTGNLQNTLGQETLSAQHVTWTNESSGGQIYGEGTLKFIENGVTTRFGTFSGADAVRLGLGDATTTATRIYGDTDPAFADLGSPQLHVLPGSANQPTDALSDVLAPGSLVTAGPGAAAHVGASTLTVGPSSTIAAGGMLTSGYFIDLTPASLALTITPRTLTPTVGDGAWVYGSPTSVATLSGLVNGDVLTPVATLNGTAGVAMSANGSGYGFGQKLGAGTSTFTLTGLAGSAASDYTLDLSGHVDGTLTVAPKPLTFATGSGSQTYGTAGTSASTTPSGLLAGDVVGATIGYTLSGTTRAFDARMPAGTYDTSVTALSGPDAANYTIATSGNSDGSFVVNPKPVSWSVANATSTYGTTARLGTAGFAGVLAGDDVSGIVAATSGGTPFAPVATTRAGTYGEIVTGLAGAAADNYVLAGSGNASGTLTVAPKLLTYSGDSISVTYGSTALPTLTLTGVVGGDAVSGVQFITGGTLDVGRSGARPVGSYSTGFSTLTGADASNYTLFGGSDTFGALTVTPKSLTFSTASAASTYGTAASLAAPTLSGVLAGDVIGGTASLSAGGGAFVPADRTHAGSYAIGVQSSDLSGAGASNYVVAASGNSAGTLVVSPKPVTWQVGGSTATYGDAPSATTTFTGVLSGDSLGAQLAALDSQGTPIARPGVGSYQAGVAALTGASASDYALAGSGNTTGALTVVPRTLTYSVANANSVYGDLATLGTVTFANAMAGDNVGAVESLSTFGNAVALGPRVHAGSYDEVVTGLTNPNYVLAPQGNATGVLTVAPKPLTYTTADTASIYGTATTPAASLAGVLPGDSVSAGTPILRATGAAPTARQDVGTYAIGLNSLAGADASNYVTTDSGSTFGTLTISPKTVTYSLQGYFANTYFGALGGSAYQNFAIDYGNINNDLPVARVTINGAVAGDDVSVTTSTINFTRSGSGNLNVGTYTYTGGALTGSRAGNYVLAATGNTDATLTIRPLTMQMVVQAEAQNLQTNSGTYGTTGSYQIKSYANNVLAGDDVSVDGWFALAGGNTSTLPDRLPVGTYHLGGAVRGADAGNYVVQASIGDFTVSPRPVTFNTNDTFSTYGDAAAIPATTLNGTLAGDDVSATSWLPGFSGAGTMLPARLPALVYNVGVTLAGSAASNYVLTNNADVERVFGLPASRPGVVDVFKRALGYAIDPASFNITYGDLIGGGVVSGVLSGDTVGVDETLQAIKIHGVSASGALYAVNTLLPAGTYNWNTLLSGASASNYYLPGGPSFGVVTVAPRPLSVVINPIDTVYGSYVAPVYGWVGLVNNQDIQPNLAITADATGKTVTYGQQTSAGSYTQTISALVPPAGTTTLADPTLNYVFVPTPGASAKLDIARKPLTFTPVASSDVTYGSAVPLGTLAGVLFGDDVGLQTNAAAGMPAQRLGADSSGTLDYTTKLDAGTYAWSTALAGAKSGNYVISAPSGSFNVAQKVIIYAVDNAEGQHGDYRACDPTSGCNPWVPGAVVGTARFEGVLAGDNVAGTVAITDLNGNLTALDNHTPVGQYFEVVTGLTGTQAKNYRIAASGSRPGLFTLTPEWISYATSSAIYLQGSGLIGTPGVPTLRGPDGAFSDPDLTPLVQATNKATGEVITDLQHLTSGATYTFRVVGLGGADAGDFRLLPDNGNNALGTYGKNDAGTLTVFSSTALGFGLLGNTPIPPAPVIPTPSPAPAVTAPPLSGYFSSKNSDDGTDFGRNITGTGAAGDTQIGPTGVGASGTASGVAEGSVDLGGGVDVSAQASGEVSALAKFGITGVRLEADAEAHVDVTIQVGPGYVEFGAQGDAYAIATVSRTGAQLGADAQAGASGQGGVAGDLGGGVDGNVDATVSTFVFARTDDSVGLVDGKAVTHVGGSAGVGVSAGVDGGISGDVGSVDAGATVYSPGSVGGNFNYTAGYSDGDLSMSLDIGAELGFGGVDLRVGFSLDVGGFISDLGDMFGFTHHSAPTPPTTTQILRTDYDNSNANDPVARFNYLNSNQEWLGEPNQSVDGLTFDQAMARAVQYYKALAFYNSFKSLLADTASLAQQEVTAQTTLVNLLKTDPAAAVAYAHSTDFTAMAAREAQLKKIADGLHLSLAVADGKFTYVDATNP